MSTKKRIKQEKAKEDLNLINRLKEKYKETKTIIKAIIITIIAVSVLSLLILGNNLRIDTKYKDAWHIKALNLDASWWSKSGEGVTIAFLDTGITEELKEQYVGRIKDPYNIIDNTKDITDKQGHGSSMICAATCEYNKSGVYGVAPKADIMPIVVVDEAGRTDGETLAKGINYAIEKKADIINLSIGSKIENQEVKEAIEEADKQGIIVVAAAGDYSEDKILYPAKYESTIAVASQSKLGVKYKHASYSENVDYLMPGEYIQTLGIKDDGEHGIVYESGSSISTALMSGTIALKLETKDKGYAENKSHIKFYEQKSEFLNINKFRGGIISAF